jgi:hypothetical protein
MGRNGCPPESAWGLAQSGAKWRDFACFSSIRTQVYAEEVENRNIRCSEPRIRGRGSIGCKAGRGGPVLPQCHWSFLMMAWKSGRHPRGHSLPARFSPNSINKEYDMRTTADQEYFRTTHRCLYTNKSYGSDQGISPRTSGGFPAPRRLDGKSSFSLSAVSATSVVERNFLPFAQLHSFHSEEPHTIRDRRHQGERSGDAASSPPLSSCGLVPCSGSRQSPGAAGTPAHGHRENSIRLPVDEAWPAGTARLVRAERARRRKLTCSGGKTWSSRCKRT